MADLNLKKRSDKLEAIAWEQIGTTVPVDSQDTNNEEERSGTPVKDDDACSEHQLHLDEDAIQIDPADEFVTEDKAGRDDDAEGKGQGDEERKDDEYEPMSHRTNSTNPGQIRARVFVGHLNTDKCSRTEVEKLFTPFGKICSCSLQQGYGFVQYEEEESARKAIRSLHGKEFFGIKLVVDKPVALKKLEGESIHGRKPWPGDDDYLTEAEYFRKRRELLDELEELERRYLRDHPPLRDPVRYPSERYGDRLYERPPDRERGRLDRYLDHGPVDRHTDRGYPDYGERERLYDRYVPPLHESYDRPRDDPYDKRYFLDRYGPTSRRL